ncbi:MAG: amidase [Acidobacteria bacterium]|nr:amidase [Acidobacteriota bacterium]MBI3657699.1 amidase [Acidobacteriota bacterium]
MKKKGRFILFALSEFGEWLKHNHFHRVIHLIQNHHTFIPDYSHFKGNNHFVLLDRMENAHFQRGFSEIAQNLTTFPDGTIAVCRSLDKIPAGIKGANQNGICLENVGNFDRGADTMSAAQKEAIIQLNALLCTKFGLTSHTDTIVYHHWYDLITGVRTNGSGTTKSCAGTNFFGGNTIEAAEAQFIPLIEQALSATVTSGTHGYPPPLRTGEVTAFNLNVRIGPSASSRVVKTLPKGIIVPIFEERDGWYRIHPGEPHWVNGRYMR